MSAYAGNLSGALIEIHIVGLVGVGAGTGSRHRDVDRVINRDQVMDEATGKGPVSAVAGAVAAACDQVGADRTVVGPQANRGGGYVPAFRRVAVSALSAYPGDLSGALIEMNSIRLIGAFHMSTDYAAIDTRGESGRL